MATSNQQMTAIENQLGQVVLPQVSAMIQAGNITGAKALLQQGLNTYYQGISQFKAAGGNLAIAANGSISNTALQNTISTLSQKVGLQYIPGSGAIDPNAPSSTDAAANQYGLTAPTTQGNPYGVTAPNVSDATQIQQPNSVTQLTNGQGYSPQTLANMNATAVEAPAAAGQQELAQAKIALSQNGLYSSPAAAALQENVARSVGQQQIAGKNQVQTNNAQVANQNMQIGAGMQNSNAQAQATAQNTQNNLRSSYNFGAQTTNQSALQQNHIAAMAAMGGG